MNAPGVADGPHVEIAVAVVEHEGQYLIGLRPEGVPLGGFWEFPGGKVVSGESPEEAARRECLEETGLEVRVTGNYPPVVHDYPHGRVHLSFFACAAVAAVRPLPTRFRWVPTAELGEYRFPPANEALLGLLAELHSQRQRG
jgi:8-oxo-dGTP diphosphatase